MLRSALAIITFLLAQSSFAQKIDSIFFNLYTDSLKKGTYNYINVEGRYDDGSYQPLGEKELKFTTSAGKFVGNSLYIDSVFADDYVTVRVVAKQDSKLLGETRIYIKKHEGNERLPSMDEVLQGRAPDTSSPQDADTPRRKKKKRR